MIPYASGIGFIREITCRTFLEEALPPIIFSQGKVLIHYEIARIYCLTGSRNDDDDGTNITINSGKEDLVKAVMEVTDNLGADAENSCCSQTTKTSCIRYCCD